MSKYLRQTEPPLLYSPAWPVLFRHVKGVSENTLHDPVAVRCLFEPGGTELRRAFLGLEVNVHKAETGTKTAGPLQVIKGTPYEIPLYRHPFRDCSV